MICWLFFILYFLNLCPYLMHSIHGIVLFNWSVLYYIIIISHSNVCPALHMLNLRGRSQTTSRSFGFFLPPAPLRWQFLPYKSRHFLTTYLPSSIYSCSISPILGHEFFCLGCLGNQGSEEKSGFEFFWAGGFCNF